jgi:hypothetical protein
MLLSLLMIKKKSASVADRLAGLTSQMHAGINAVAGNPDLEIAYLNYQQAVLDERYLGEPNFKRLDQLPARERDQIDAIAARLVDRGIVSAALVAKRLERTRVLSVDEHYSHVLQKKVGGQFENGLAIVAGSRSPDYQNHALLHEITHGLTATGHIALMGSAVLDFGIGLDSKRTANGGSMDVRTMVNIHDLAEAVVDTWVLDVSDFDTPTYLAGAFPDVGYWQSNNALLALTTSRPDFVSDVHEAAFSTGVRDPQHGESLVKTFLTAAPHLLDRV